MKTTKSAGCSDYAERKRRQAEKNVELVRTGQEIGKIPDVENPERKAASLASFKTFCETYFSEVFYLAWSDDHLRVIEKIERAVVKGSLCAIAMPRGSGKSSLCQVAVVWAALKGAASLVCLIAASAERGKDLLENIKTWLETNELLQADFPEVCYPIQCLERFSDLYYREDGMQMKVSRTLIDANWGQSTDVVYQFCRQSKFSGVLFPSHGKYVGASSIPFSDYRTQRGDRVGLHWRIPNISGKRQVRHVLIDTNYWKTFVHARLGVMMGDPGCLSLYGHEPKAHLMLSEHLIAEYRIKTLANGRTVDEWKWRSNRPDNHWLDCMVGCAVAASIEGVELASLRLKETIVQRPRIKLSDKQRNRFSR